MANNKNPYCQCLYFSANALSRQVTRMAEEEFAITGLSPSYAFLMMSINKHERISSGQLAEEMMLTPSTITRLVDKLEAKGLVSKVHEGRQTFIFNSKKGTKLNALILEAWNNFYKRYTAILGEKFAAKLTQQIAEGVTKMEIQEQMS